MGELVRQHDLNLVIRMLRQQCIGQEDPARPPHPCQRSVGLPGSVAKLPFEDTEYPRPGPLGEPYEPLTQRWALQRPARVEHGEQKRRPDLREEHEEAHEAQ